MFRNLYDKYIAVIFWEPFLSPPFLKGDLGQQCPVRKLHAVALPPSPSPSPPEAWGEGEGEVAGFSDHLS
ncbi:MAG TPA: hypothetical protein VFC55_00615, partial [Desulfobaccales bacterium]|nr:hypothetical protein [Desulfobaccales bacterium]